jgi:hypothetical protein
MHEESTTPTVHRRGRRALSIGAALLVSIGAFGAAVDAHGGGHTKRQKADVLDPADDLYQRRGAKLVRTDHSIEVTWKIDTPRPESYSYPPAPDGHPAIVPGYPEVFTLWIIVFDNPEECTDPCDGDDVGDTPAQGSVYQADGEIADKHHLKMSGKTRLGQTPRVGPGLSNPLGAEVHLAMAPHGQATSGDELGAQLNNPAGDPSYWWGAIFLAP